MNQKTAKLLRRWAARNGYTIESAKNAWRHLWTPAEKAARRAKLKSGIN